MMDKVQLVYIIGSFLAVMIIITLHEFAHAYVAYKCGDPTAKFYGRMTLNPAKHFDPLGIVMFALAGFGWAKPVPVNPNNFRNYRWGSFWTSAAGIITNYLSAFLFCPIWALVYLYVMPTFEGTYMYYLLAGFFGSLVVSSLSFCVFNLLPFFPLDGFRMIDALNRTRGRVYTFLKEYGYQILLGLILLHFLSTRIPYLAAIDLLGYVLNFVKSIFAKPIVVFWEWIFEICGKPLHIVL
jgi:Zn-dependent protease